MSEIEFQIIDPRADHAGLQAARGLLADCQLAPDDDVEVFVAAWLDGQLAACAGLAGNVIKCVAIAPALRGEALSLTLVNEAVQLAAERGHFQLFLYTRPESAAFFAGCGFYPLAEAPGLAVLMENSPVAISRYCSRLRMLRQPSNRTGCVVMNANPFTRGHRYLAEQAAADCDWLHVFVVREDVSAFPYAERFELVRQGLAGIPNLTLHHGSEYMISRATFPCYFLKEKGLAAHCHTAIDLLLFRERIAPALGISHRYVGTEPFCPVTNKYNKDMRHWLQQAASEAPPVAVVEMPRARQGGRAVSASEVRRLLARRDFLAIEPLVPASTLRHLLTAYAEDPHPDPERYG
nr:[citrate (pro-3S)-lyase] ligase [Chromobacterium sp. ASV5]